MFNFYLAHQWQSQAIPFVIATVMETSGSTPRLQGTQMLINAKQIDGSIGGGRIEYEIIQSARQMLATSHKVTNHLEIISKHLSHDLAMCCGGSMTVALQAYIPTARLWIYGAGHVATALAQQASLLQWPCTVVDERTQWADPQRFATDIDVRCEDICEEIRMHPPQINDYAFVCTHDHALDEDIMTLLLQKPIHYLALIGSQRKWLQFQKRLRAKGIDPVRLEQVSCPAGLSIEAQTPMEIAISIVAELIQIKSSHVK